MKFIGVALSGMVMVFSLVSLILYELGNYFDDIDDPYIKDD